MQAQHPEAGRASPRPRVSTHTHSLIHQTPAGAGTGAEDRGLSKMSQVTTSERRDMQEQITHIRGQLHPASSPIKKGTGEGGVGSAREVKEGFLQVVTFELPNEG